MGVIYSRGEIVFVAQVTDNNGVNPKDRPVVLVRDLEDGDDVAFGVAVTSSFAFPLPPSSIPLPFHRNGACRSGLTLPSIADCTWIVLASPADIIRRCGTTPAAKFVAILQQVQAFLPPPPQPPSGSVS